MVPGIETKFRSDIRTLKSFCELAMPQHVSAFDEIEKQFCSEFDYIEEGKNLQTVHDLVMPKWQHAVVIPQPKMKFCSKTLLVMEYLEGVKLVDGINLQYRALAKQTGRSFEDMIAEQKEQMASGTFKFKSIQDSKADRERLGWYLFLQDCVNPTNVSRFMWNNTVGLAWGHVSYDRTVPPIDLGHMIEILAHVHGDQIFEHGKLRFSFLHNIYKLILTVSNCFV
ncbi:hypothetical protein EON65_57165 [archaeon]|nr:MAG: hypothetical protein EON65_57165 [archaeon]